MEQYWFVTQDPKVLEYEPEGLWVLDKFKNSHVNLSINVNDWVAIYEPQHNRDKTRSDGMKAVVALAKVTELLDPWRLEGDYWRIAKTKLVYKDVKGVPAETVVKIITGNDAIRGQGIGWFLNRRYSGRITEIGKDKFNAIAKYFTIDDFDDAYQEEVERATPAPNPLRGPTRPQYQESDTGKKLITDNSLAKYCKVQAQYICEANSGHISFLSKVTGQNFVEVHHLIPLKAQPEFVYALDNIANIVCLCPNCHRLLHHAADSEKQTTLKALFNYTRKQSLKNRGTPITFEELLKYY